MHGCFNGCVPPRTKSSVPAKRNIPEHHAMTAELSIGDGQHWSGVVGCSM